MADDILRCGLGEVGVKQGTAASLGEFLPAGTTAQQAEPVVPIDLAHSEIGRARATKQVAFRVDTG